MIFISKIGQCYIFQVQNNKSIKWSCIQWLKKGNASIILELFEQRLNWIKSFSSSKTNKINPWGIKSDPQTEFTFYQTFLTIECRKVTPLQGPKESSCLTLRSERFKEIHKLTKAKDFIREGCPRRRAAGEENPGELLCHVAHSLSVYGNGVGFQVVSGQSFWLRVLPDGACLSQPRWIAVRRILGGW